MVEPRSIIILVCLKAYHLTLKAIKDSVITTENKQDHCDLQNTHHKQKETLSLKEFQATFNNSDHCRINAHSGRKLIKIK